MKFLTGKTSLRAALAVGAASGLLTGYDAQQNPDDHTIPYYVWYAVGAFNAVVLLASMTKLGRNM